MVSTIPAEFRTQYMNQRVKGWEVFICTISNMLKRKGVKITKHRDRSAHQGVPPFMLKIQAILIACNHHLKECNDWFDSSHLIMNDKIAIYRKSRSYVAQSAAERIINVYNEELSVLQKLMSGSDRIPILRENLQKMRNSYTTIMELKESMETIARIAQKENKPRGVESWKHIEKLIP
ncbi:Protein CBG27414 [Caenorhabditis briggsae]|nr:Protein CBG27414 [Caenorhabditis briggsae]CAS00221.1 Protein CBG27414 [Caenorhabditis briggsae]